MAFEAQTAIIDVVGRGPRMDEAQMLMEVPVLATVAAVRHHQPRNGQGCNEIILAENQNHSA